jgi:S-adenosylmethionine synthetase
VACSSLPPAAAPKWLTRNVRKLSPEVKAVLDSDQDHFGVDLAGYHKLTASDDDATNTISGMIGH